MRGRGSGGDPVDWVWDRSKARGADRLVLLAIAEHADRGTGENAWPAVETLAEMVGGVDVRNVKRAIRRLEDLGELRVELNKGGGPDWRGDRRPNRYTILLGHAPDRTQRATRARARRRGGAPTGTSRPKGNGVASAPPRTFDSASDAREVPQVSGYDDLGDPLGVARTPPRDPDDGVASTPSRGASDGVARTRVRGGASARHGVASAPPDLPIDQTQDQDPPNPPRSGGHGRRAIGTNPRARGTNPRGPRAPDPADVAVAAFYTRLEATDLATLDDGRRAPAPVVDVELAAARARIRGPRP